MRIDHAFSWEHPLSAHGLMHTVITHASRGDPYRLDTLMIFMANMAWNSTMNTLAVREMLNAKDEDGEFKIPFLVVCDAFQSETVAFADLVLPDTTYLERHDVMSMLDRPISSSRPGRFRARRSLPTLGGARRARTCWASWHRAHAACLHHGGRRAQFRTIPTRRTRADGHAFGGWRGADGSGTCAARQYEAWEMYAKNDCVFSALPETRPTAQRNRGTSTSPGKGWRQKNGWSSSPLRDTLPRRRARRDKQGPQPPVTSPRLALPILCPSGIAPLEDASGDTKPIRSTRSPSADWHVPSGLAEV